MPPSGSRKKGKAMIEISETTVWFIAAFAYFNGAVGGAALLGMILIIVKPRQPEGGGE
jgi:hypothetical protein